MSQVETGIRSILKSPRIYNFMQNMMGGARIKKDLVENYISPVTGDYILDIGCGTAEILKFLPNSINYYGFDQSQVYIDFAESVYSGKGVFKAELVDDLAVDNLPKMDRVIASGLIHHLSDNEVLSLFSVAKKSLKEGGAFVAIDPCYSAGQNKLAKYLIDTDRGNHVRMEKEYKELAESIFDKVDTKVVHRKWVPYTHNILTCYV